MIKKRRGRRKNKCIKERGGQGRKGKDVCGLFKSMYAYCKKEDKSNVRVTVA